MNIKKDTVVVLGGGIGGVVSANQIKKKLGDKVRVIVIDKNSEYLFSPSLPWLLVGKRKAAKITRPMKNIEKNGVELVVGEVKSIDTKSKKVIVNQNEIEFDYLVVSLGADLDPTSIPGLEESGHNIYSLDGAKAIQEKRMALEKGKLVVLVCSMPFKCPAAPYESAMILEHDFKKRGLRKNVEVAIYTPEPGPMPVAGEVVSDKLKEMLSRKNIHYYPKSTVVSIDPAKKQIKFSNDEAVTFDLLAYVPPHKAPSVLVNSGLTGESGWISVDKFTLETEFENIYAIGDNTGIKLSCGKPLPKAGVFAHGQAETVASHIVSKIKKTGNPTTFNGHGECFIEIGGPFAGVGKGNFYAEPLPDVQVKRPGLFGHLGKVLFERYWLTKWY